MAVPVHIACRSDLSDGAFRTYCILRRYCFGGRTYCWPSIRTLAAQRGCSDETIRRHLRELVNAGLVTISRRGRRNLYCLGPVTSSADEHKPAEISRPSASFVATALEQDHAPDISVKHAWDKPAIETVVQQLFAETSGSSSDVIPHKDLGQEDLIPHKTVTQGITQSEKHISTSHAGDPKVPFTEQPNSSSFTQAQAIEDLINHGVSPPIARRLVAQYGPLLCKQAIELLNNYYANGATIRNPGGWLYTAITHGYFMPRDIDLQATGSPLSNRSSERVTREERHQTSSQAQDASLTADISMRVQAEEIRRRSREALARRGIPPEAQDLWERVIEDVKAQGYWSPALAAAYLRPMGERRYVLQCLCAQYIRHLRHMLPVLKSAVRRQGGGADCELWLSE